MRHTHSPPLLGEWVLFILLTARLNMNKSSKALRVLLVDESPHRAGAVEQALRQAGHAVAAHVAPHDDLRAR